MKRLAGKRGEHQYDPQKVLYLTGNINYCYLHMANGDVILSCRTLKWFADQWTDFVRVHKNALVNLAYVTFCKVSEKVTDANYLVMADQAQLDISRRRVPIVSDVLAQRNIVVQPEMTY